MDLMSNEFRPWCPKCNLTSPPAARRCATCGLALYPGSRNLYEGGRSRRRLASPTENKRVRDVYWNEKVRTLQALDHPLGHGGGGTCKICGDYRGDLARDWVAMVDKSQTLSDVELVMPGGDPDPNRRQPDPKKTMQDYRIDAARVRIREFESGQDQSDWVLVGLETTIAERRNRQYPAGAYRSQRRLWDGDA